MHDFSKHRCEWCGEKFVSISDHVSCESSRKEKDNVTQRWVTRKNICVCNICGTAHQNIQKLEEHFLINHHCDWCSLSFQNKQEHSVKCTMWRDK